MRVFKDTYKDKNGKRREASKWTVEFIDHQERPRRLAAFTDKKATEELGRKLGRLAAIRVAGERPDKPLTEWLETLPKRMMNKLQKIGLVDSRSAAASKPLADHVGDYKQALLDKGNTEKHASMTANRIKAIHEGIKAEYVSQVTAGAVSRYLAELREGTAEDDGISARTSNGYLQAEKSFFTWMVRERRISQSPVEHLQKLNEKTDRRHVRRVLAVKEFKHLLAKTFDGPESYEMTGPERAMLYRLAVETGLRANELRSLKPTSFDLDTDEPTVTVAAGYSKRRREDVLPLRPLTAKELGAFLSDKFPNTPVFKMPDKTSEMLKEDLDDAKIPYRDDADRVFDFHALRHQFGSNLAAADVHPKVAQELMRHSTITLTMDRYTHTSRGKLSAAVDALPDLSQSDQDQARATGTDDAEPEKAEFYSASYSAPKGSESSNSVQEPAVSTDQTVGSKNDENPLENALSGASKGFSSNETDGNRTRNLRIDSPIL